MFWIKYIVLYIFFKLSCIVVQNQKSTRNQNWKIKKKLITGFKILSLKFKVKLVGYWWHCKNMSPRNGIIWIFNTTVLFKISYRVLLYACSPLLYYVSLWRELPWIGCWRNSKSCSLQQNVWFRVSRHILL